MKFALTFDGRLPSNGDRQDKWDIRKLLVPQLEELWGTNHVLQETLRNRLVPTTGGYLIATLHHSLDAHAKPLQLPKGDPGIDTCAVIQVGPRAFLPLVRNTLGLTCTLDILFLRKEEPGNIVNRGDLDNRLKTLFDALSIPDAQQIVPDTTIADPIYCLMENDRLITGVNIETRQLLNRPNSHANEVRLIIDVTVNVTHARAYNHQFLAD